MHYTRITLFIVFLCGGGSGRTVLREGGREGGKEVSDGQPGHVYAQIGHIGIRET